MTRRFVTFWLVPLALTSLSAIAADTDVAITTPQEIVSIAPGSHVDMPITISNRGSTAWTEPRLSTSVIPSTYGVEQRSQPDCGPFEVDFQSGGYRTLVSQLSPIAPGEDRTCVVRITRDASEINNTLTIWTAMVLGTGFAMRSVDVGTFVDISVSAVPISSLVDNEGMTHTVFRLDARNNGQVDAANVSLGLGPVCVGSPLQVDTNLSGGCQSDQVECGFTGGPAPAARFPVVPANSTQSCLVRLSAPRDAHAEVQSYLAPDRLTNAATGGRIGDLDDSNNQPLLKLDIPNGQGAAVGAPALSPWAVGLLLLLLSMAAGVGVQRVRRRY